MNIKQAGNYQVFLNSSFKVKNIDIERGTFKCKLEILFLSSPFNLSMCKICIYWFGQCFSDVFYKNK